jgi:PAS domain S-box-containing protein
MLVLAVLVGLAPEYLTRSSAFLLVAPTIAAVFGLEWIVATIFVEIVLVGVRFGYALSLETVISGTTILGLLTVMRWILGRAWKINQEHVDVVLLQADVLRAVEQPVFAIKEEIIVFANQAAVALFEVEFKGIVLIGDMFEEKKEVQDVVRRVIEMNHRHTIECHGKRQNRLFPARVVIEPIRDQSRIPVGVVVAISDLSEQRAAAQALHNTRHLWAIFAGGSRDMMTILDARSNYILVTDACHSLLGYQPDELLGTSARTLMHPDDYPSARETFRRLFTGENSSVSNMYRMKRRDGSWVWVEFWSRRTTYNGEPVIATISRDATAELSEMREDYRAQSIAEIARRIGFIVHDIRNNSEVLMKNLDVLESQVGDSGKSSVHKISGQLNRIVTIVNQINRLVGNVETKPEMVFINHVIMGLQVWLESWNPDRIHIQLALSSELQIYIDKVLVERVITNIVSNSFDAMPRGGVIRIRTYDSVRKSGVVMMIQDNGMGIPLEYINRVFEPRFSTKKKGTLIGGSGMGLCIVRELVEQNGGFVRVRSKEGVGTVVMVFFPKNYIES